MARISIATTANCHDYKAKPTTSIVANATGLNEEENEGRDLLGLPAGPTRQGPGACYSIGLY